MDKRRFDGPKGRAPFKGKPGREGRPAPGQDKRRSMPGGQGASGEDKRRSMPGGQGASGEDKRRFMPGGQGAPGEDKRRSMPGGQGAPRQDKRRFMPGGQGAPGRDRRRSAPGEDSARALQADARKVALMALSDVNRSGAYAQLALGQHLRAAQSLSPEDKRLATMIFYAALENRLRINWVLGQFVSEMPEDAVEEVLHIAAAQLLFMDRVPDHAAVDQAVKQIKALGREKYAPLVNGALRSLIRARDGGGIRYPSQEEDPIKYLSVMHSLPEALSRRLVGQYGLEEAARMIAYRPDERTQTVRPNLLRMDDGAFEAYLDERGWTWERGTVPHAYHVRGGGDLAGDPGYRAGLFSVQGEGSMLPCQAIAPRDGQYILDACAAPGGKASLLCEMMHLTGRVQAWEKHEHRCQLLHAAQRRLKLDNLRVAARDAGIHRDEYDLSFDAVLIDAPCSGLGVMIDKPDIKYRVNDQDIESLARTQERILNACAPYVKVGGHLVYSTCTILREENQDQVEAFLKAHPNFRLDPDGGFLPEKLRDRWQGGWVQFQAHRDGIEGFFIAKMIREEI